jgi:carbon monoxide dehydrogenase subunit G
MDIEKTFRVAAAQAEVWEFVTSAENVANCMPGVEEVIVQGPGQFKGVMKIKVGPIKTSVKADVIELEQRVPEYASYSIKGEEGGRASRLTSDTELFLSPLSDEETEVRFVSHVVIVGRLGKFAGGVMKKMADSICEQFIVAFRAELEPQPELPAVEPRKGLWARFVDFLRRLFGGSSQVSA